MILIVQSNATYRQHIADSLLEVGLQVNSAESVPEATRLMRQSHYALVILDVAINGGSGFELCRSIIAEHLSPTLIFVSDTVSAADELLGLELGADDFIRYPCQARELQARVKVQLRHAEHVPVKEKDDTSSKVHCHDLMIDHKQFIVTLKGEPVRLTATEFALLFYLARHPNQVFSRLQLLDAVWGYQHSGYEHTVNTHINRLRNKLCDSAGDLIETVWGVGYRLTAANPPAMQPSQTVTPLRPVGTVKSGIA